MAARVAGLAFALSAAAVLLLACNGSSSLLDGTAQLTSSDSSAVTVPDDPTSTVTGHLLVQNFIAKSADVAKPQVYFDTEAPVALVAGELLVVFDEDTTDAERIRILAEHGMSAIERSPSGLYRVACPIKPGRDAQDARTDTLDHLQRLLARKGVRRASPNQRRQIARVPNDTSFPHQWNCPLINLPEAWDVTTGSDDIIVAVVDTGILSGHPDLAGRLVPGYDFVSDPGSARDGDGRDPNPEDPGDQIGGVGQSSFHGTHVAGTIGAATNNGLGVAGVTWQGKIMPVRALGKGGGTSFDVAEAIRFAAGLPNVSGTVPAKPARIINLSVSGMPGDPPAQEEVAAITEATNAGVLVVAAAGNQGSSYPAWPAAQPEVISVGAVDMLGHRATYSNYGSSVDLMAPGGMGDVDLNADGYVDGVLSTSATDVSGGAVFQYLFGQGTSMASPHVAGVAALVMAANPALSATDVRAILETTARDLGDVGRDLEFGMGLVDAGAAVREAVRRGGPPVGAAPVLSLSSTVLDFGEDLREFRVRVLNAGGGFLNITSVTQHESEGAGWLYVSTDGSNVTASIQEIVITVTRAQMADGVYHGLVSVNADGLTPGIIAVSMTVAPVTRPGEVVYVLAVDPATMQPVAQASTTAEGSFGYHLDALPPGNYLIYAGTDRNGDGYIGDAGDLCGALPTLGAPTPLAVSAGDWLLDIDFPIAELWSDTGQPQTLHLPLMP